MSIVERLKDNKRIKLFGEILLLHHNAELDYIVPSDQGGFVPTRNEMEELLIEISRFYETISDAEIEEYNEMVYSKKFSREDRSPSPQEKIVKKYAGYVYLIKADNGLYKIGKTRNISERMKPFSVSFPMAWYMVHHFHADDYSQAEKTLHEIYSKKRDIGEWFRLDSSEVNVICGISSYECGKFNR